jgi:diaminohydroxyphosphoribosylaminopyrimidine deaminase/5-amino-6-(5-phosphoribosylamino)uracil reductase|tara:strand:- start:611 stop:1720 length:1110 start_codon:yes stop_codon:yes gene_type:complete
MTKSDDQAYMVRAVQLARKGLYTTDPNPRVGCVLVKAGEIIGEGWHERAGDPHAEIIALNQAGGQARNSTAFVTLEPCCHTGRTGPCVEAIIEAGISRVVCSAVDPSPLVFGAGLRRLEQAGIIVETGLLEDSAANLNPGYLMRMKCGRPLVRSKLAVSLDGRTALASGESQWITGEASRVDVHSWRARSSAVVTGIGTVLNDDPSLNARLTDSNRNVLQPLRIVIDSQLQTPPSAKLIDLPGGVVIFTKQSTLLHAQNQAQALSDKGVIIEAVSGVEQCNLEQVIQRLGEMEINEVWVEAGAKLNGSLLEMGLVDELILYVAPHFLGADSQGMFCIEPLASLEHRIQVTYEDISRVGEDIRIIACLAE